MTLGLFKSSKIYVATLMMLGLLVHTPSVVANMEKQESPTEKLNEQRAERQEEDVSNKTQHTRPYIQLRWDKVMSQTPCWMFLKHREDARDYLSRVKKRIKTFLSAFEDAYGVRVVWEDVADKYPDMTREFSSFAILVQGLKRTLSDEKALQKVTPILLKEKNSTERGKFQ